MIINHLKTKDNHISYHQPQRGALNANCGEHDLVHKEKHQDAGGDGGGDDHHGECGDGDDHGECGDGDDRGECGETKQHVLLLIITGLVKTAFI